MATALVMVITVAVECSAVEPWKQKSKSKLRGVSLALFGFHLQSVSNRSRKRKWVKKRLT